MPTGLDHSIVLALRALKKRALPARRAHRHLHGAGPALTELAVSGHAPAQRRHRASRSLNPLPQTSRSPQ
jgi:hypothetical protein